MTRKSTTRSGFAVSDGVCHVLDEDPDLTSRLTADDVRHARRVAMAPVTQLGPGYWTPDAVDPGALGLLVLDGVMVRCASIGASRGVELLGGGDVLQPWETYDAGSVAFTESWEAVTPMRMALLDAQFHHAVARWPGIVAELLARCVARSNALVRHRAISHLPRLETRLLLTLWAIGDRWGKVEADGVSISLPIPQRLLADLVSASRQRVNGALADLALAGDVERRGDRIVLRRSALEALEQSGVAAAAVALAD